MEISERYLRSARFPHRPFRERYEVSADRANKLTVLPVYRIPIIDLYAASVRALPYADGLFSKRYPYRTRARSLINFICSNAILFFFGYIETPIISDFTLRYVDGGRLLIEQPRAAAGLFSRKLERAFDSGASPSRDVCFQFFRERIVGFSLLRVCDSESSRLFVRRSA